jgi:hypothetical protein
MSKKPLHRGWVAAWFVFVILAMLWVTVTASFDRDVLTAGREIWQDPWGKATLFDAYFAFLAVYLWMAWRERTWLSRLLWLVAILTLGNFAISAYVLLALLRLPAGAGVETLLARKPLARS